MNRRNFGGADSPGNTALDRVAAELAPMGPPIIIFNAAHSGSGLLASTLAESGVFMGTQLNVTFDALQIVPLVRYVVEQYVPDVARLFREPDSALSAIALKAIGDHLAGRQPGQRWGWKLGETVYILPLLAVLFPAAHFVHVVRDGRDVAFSPFVAPKDPFWRKVYFNTDRITSWHGLALTQRAYRARGPIFNAARWVNSVTLGRAYGAMLGARCCEVRYEDLVQDFAGTIEALFAWLEIPQAVPATTRSAVHQRSVGKWRKQPRRAIDAVTAVLEPTLTCLSYSEGGQIPMFQRDPLWRRLGWS